MWQEHPDRMCLATVENIRYDLDRISAIISKKLLAEREAEGILVDGKLYDFMIGYRADDSYFTFIPNFVANAISLQQLKEAMCKLYGQDFGSGNQL